ncbi:methylated-DNA--[protein]-cysteine S-methyltransferase, partial [Flavobacterium macrobrachii]|uniref:methylated-DNA--[protein]-cysteine S-methyltransferase n=1 Tax=Flavobacterium macrobrachii TaxID=591204 RepID=UPI0037BE828F
MKTCFINSPLGITKIVGDLNGISEISITSEGKISKTIPLELQEAAKQLSDYFDGKRKHFNFKLNPKGTEFQQKVWQELLTIPFGKTISYLDLSKKLGDVKAIRAVA